MISDPPRQVYFHEPQPVGIDLASITAFRVDASGRKWFQATSTARRTHLPSIHAVPPRDASRA